MKVLNNDSGISLKILTHLEETFPNKLPTDPISPNELSFLQGQQSVINYLTRTFEEEQEEN